MDVAGPEGRREGDDPRPAGRPEAAPDADGGDRLRRWFAAPRAAACRIDTLDELEYYRNGGILHYVLRKLAA